MENSELWRMMQARMQSLGNLLDNLTRQSLDLMTANPHRSRQMQDELTAMRIEARQLVKMIRRDVTEAKQGA